MRLSDFRDEQALEVIAKLLEPVGAIAANERNAAARSGGVFGFASALLHNNPREVMAIFAILNGEEPEAYHCSASTVLFDLVELLNDPELLALFGLRSRTAASSGSVSANTTAEGTRKVSSSTAPRAESSGTKKRSTAST